MARTRSFVPDEQRRYPLTWLLVASLFAGATAWAVWNELVTRVPWEKEQRAFFALELALARAAHAEAEAAWRTESETPAARAEQERLAALDESRRGGDYLAAERELVRLDRACEEVERQKTFAASDRDEAAYLRTRAEHARDAAAAELRRRYPEGGAPDGDALFARLRAAELAVAERLQAEQELETRVAEAEAELGRLDGPAEPSLPELAPAARALARQAAREAACAGLESTRRCVRWLRQEPLDRERQALEAAIARRRRPLAEAEVRLADAEARARPPTTLRSLWSSAAGPYQIEQIVTRWMAAERDVDLEQVDRCPTCHLGVGSDRYRAPELPRQFRSHPARDTLLAVHPVERFGCTACHQGQGRATDLRAHSGLGLEVREGRERWRRVGDAYWEDPLLRVGKLEGIAIDAANDRLELALYRSARQKTPAWVETVVLPHGDYPGERELAAALEEGLQAVVVAHDLARDFRAFARLVDHRVSLGLEPRDPGAPPARAAWPLLRLRFPLSGTAELLGFGAAREVALVEGTARAPEPPSLPVRADAEAAMAEVAPDGSYRPPSGAAGLQLPDATRNRFLQALPEVESGCLRCHAADTDLAPRASTARHVADKLAYEKAEHERALDPVAYAAAHDGSDELPKVAPAPGTVPSLAPTLDAGRLLFRALNCTGCHTLDGFAGNRDAGPQLDDVSAKLAPEWLLSWLRAPRGTSPKTRMPNLWPAPLEPASKVPEPAGSPAHDDWLSLRASETVAIAAFLYERSEEPSLRPGTAPGTRPLRETVTALDPGAVAGASAAVGQRMFEGYGCQGCHTRHAADVPGEPVPDAWRVRERDVAPTLASIGLKTTPSWLYYWLQKPSRYWAGAAMPDLRLSDVEAASLALYLATLKSPLPDPAPVTAAEAASVRDPTERRALVPCEAAGGALLPRAACGAKLVADRGCFGCHRIAGFDELAHIAPDLGGFAKKDPSTLDFAYALADPDLQTVETFAALKLDAPRIFARKDIALRMGDFDLSPREIRALLVFLAGLTPDRPSAAFDPMARPAYAAPVRGRELVEALACRGCHVIEGRGADLDGFRTAALAADAQARAPALDGEGLRVSPEWLFGFLRKPADKGVRPWLHPEWVWPGRAHEEGAFALRMPSYALGDDDLTALVRYWSAWDGQRYPYEAPAVPARSAEEQGWAEKVMTSAQAANCMSCHYVGTLPAGAGRDLASLAPDLGRVRDCLRPEWVKAWLLGPKAFQPHTRMPSFWASASELRPDGAVLFPGEPDPFRSPAPAWGVAPAFEALPNEKQIELVRDFVFALPAGGPFPRPVAGPP